MSVRKNKKYTHVCDICGYTWQSNINIEKCPSCNDEIDFHEYITNRPFNILEEDPEDEGD